MGLAITSIAYNCVALGAFARLFFWICADDDCTFRIGTPLQVWIFMNFEVAKELFVFCVERSIEEFLDEIRRKHLSTVRTG